jgi:3-hydroxyisobutyrate dehydrogenase-like beta-hydroxyacid dehydrogenase
MKTVAVLGTGAMGSRMTKRLLAAGYRTVVYNRTAERAHALEREGAVVAATPREAAARADAVIAMVSDDAASRAIWLDDGAGAAAGLRRDTLALESSTLTPAWIGELGATLRARGARFLDAPVVGSRPQADAGALIYLIGGAADHVAAARDLLAAMGGAVHHVGPIGSATVVKLAVNAVFACQTAVLAEVLGVVRRAGLDVKDTMKLLATLPVISPAMQGIGAQIVDLSFAPLFPISLVEKDLRYLLALARSVDAAAPSCQIVHDLFSRANASGHGADNISGVAQMFK